MGSHYKPGIIGLDHTPSIDTGTLARTRTVCPGVYGLMPDDAIIDPVMRSGLDAAYTRWQKELDEEKEALRVLRDSIISYDVNTREASLPAARKGKIRLKKKGVKTYVTKVIRNLADVDCLVLHATAGRQQPVEKYWDFSVHFVIPPDGTIIQSHDEEVKTYGSHNFFNSRCVAVEFVGHFKRRIWKGKGQWQKTLNFKDVPTQQQIYSGRNLVRYLKRKLGIKHVFAHSQVANKNCPGPEIWFNVGEWAIKNGLSADGRNISDGDGNKIPKGWRDEKYDFNKFLLTPNF